MFSVNKFCHQKGLNAVSKPSPHTFWWGSSESFMYVSSSYMILAEYLCFLNCKTPPGPRGHELSVTSGCYSCAYEL